MEEEKDPKEKEGIIESEEIIVSEEPSQPSEETLEETPEETTGKPVADEIETEWAAALHVEYDPEEARRRAEQAATPPPMPQMPQMPQPAQQPQPMQQPQYSQYPQPPKPAEQPPMPDTYLVWSVLATVFCCLIPGIVAIVYSTMVSSKYYVKDFEGARKASRMAQYWIIASIVLGVITAAVYIPLTLFT